jgi:hypothetical protein
MHQRWMLLAGAALFAAPLGHASPPRFPPPVPAALAPAPTSSQAFVDRPLASAGDLVLTAAPHTFRVTPLAANGTWGRAAPGGALAIVGTTDFTGLREGDAGRAFLHPGRRPLPVTDVAPLGAHFSPDGRYVAVESAVRARPVKKGGPWVPAHPTLTVLTVPDLRVVDRIDGADAHWSGPSALVLRRGAQPFKLDVGTGRAAAALGVPQPTFGCTSESFGPEAPCRRQLSTYVMTIDPTASRWLVVDDGWNGTVDALRLLDFRSGASRTVLSLANTGEKRQRLATAVSPNGKRVCSWDVEYSRPWEAPLTSALFCAQLEGGAVERIFVGTGKPGSTLFLDDDRLLFDEGDTVHLVDLLSHAEKRVIGLPPGAYAATPLGTGHAFVMGHPLVVVDLDARTTSPVGSPLPTGDVDVVDSTAGRFIVQLRASQGLPRPFFWIDR